jgi:ribonuclease VapC
VIVLDASAIVAIMAEEAEAKDLTERLERVAPSLHARYASTVSVWEAACAVARIFRTDRRHGLTSVDTFLGIAGVRPVAPDVAITSLAIEAAQRFGQGAGYPGILNLGDCFSYATARHLRAALLFKGDDFSRTDIEAA